MKYRSYNKEIKIAHAMLRDIFHGIIIDRRDKNEEVQKEIRIPCVNGSRSRILKSMENRNKTLKLPLMTLTMDGMYRDEARVHSVNNVVQNEFGTADLDLRNHIAVPMNLSFTLSTITKYQEDMDQIIGNFIPFFNPDLYVSYPAPYNIGNINAQIVWDGTIGIDHSDSVAETDPERIIAETKFIMKIWLFPGIDDGVTPLEDKLIYKINFWYGTVEKEITAGELNAFYDVPHNISFTEFEEKIVDGDILYPEFDIVQVPHPRDPSCIEELGDDLTQEEKDILANQ
jgi:hypothetical protein